MTVFLELSSKEICIERRAYKESSCKCKMNDLVGMLIKVANQDKRKDWYQSIDHQLIILLLCRKRIQLRIVSSNVALKHSHWEESRGNAPDPVNIWQADDPRHHRHLERLDSACDLIAHVSTGVPEAREESYQHEGCAEEGNALNRDGDDSFFLDEEAFEDACLELSSWS